MSGVSFFIDLYGQQTAQSKEYKGSRYDNQKDLSFIHCNKTVQTENRGRCPVHTGKNHGKNYVQNGANFFAKEKVHNVYHGSKGNGETDTGSSPLVASSRMRSFGWWLKAAANSSFTRILLKIQFPVWAHRSESSQFSLS